MVANRLIPFCLLMVMIFAVWGKPSSKKRVCVIGAGNVGLTSAKQLSQYPEEFEPILFQKQSEIGGNWIYTNSTTVDEHGLPVHSSIYQYHRVNFPRVLQAFPDYPEFGGDVSEGSFARHDEMLQYLKNYTKNFDLRKYIKFDTNVEKVSPLPWMKWLLVTRNLNDNKIKEEQCDALIIGNGNNVKGHVPKIPGIETFPGRVIHSHIYRYPQEFANQTVVALGASFSGADISFDISRFAKTVYISHRHDRLKYEMPTNVEQAYGIVRAQGNQFILSDGKKLKADSLVLCTGYDYDYPFLDARSGIVVDGNGKYVRSVYKHLINIQYPTMAICNLPTPGLPFTVPHAQVAYFIAVLRGKVKLPSRDKMLKDAALPPGVPKSKAHHMVETILPYYNDLAVAAQYPPLPFWFINASYTFLPHLLNDPLNFRKGNLHFNTDGTIQFY